MVVPGHQTPQTVLFLLGDYTSVERFKAVETAHNDSQWRLAKHYEIIPEIDASVATYTEREHAIRLS